MVELGEFLMLFHHWVWFKAFAMRMSALYVNTAYSAD